MASPYGLRTEEETLAESAADRLKRSLRGALGRLGSAAAGGPRFGDLAPEDRGRAYAFPEGKSAWETFLPSRDVTLEAAGAMPGPGRGTPGGVMGPRQGEAAVEAESAILPKVGNGQEAEFDRDVASRDIEKATEGRVREVTRADGSKVFTNLRDEDVGPSDGRGEVSGQAGSVYVQPGGETDPGAAAALPGADLDRSPGWALRKVLNQQHAAGTLSMDPRDVSDRQRWEDQTVGRETEQMVQEAQAARAMEGPMETAGASEQIEQESTQQRIASSLQAYNEITQQIDAHYQMPQSPARDEIISRLEMQRRELANLLQGFQLKDPRPADPMAAMFAALAGPRAAPEP